MCISIIPPLMNQSSQQLVYLIPTRDIIIKDQLKKHTQINAVLNHCTHFKCMDFKDMSC